MVLRPARISSVCSTHSRLLAAKGQPSKEYPAPASHRKMMPSVPPLDVLRAAADDYRRAERERDAARERLRREVLAAIEDGIPLAVVARAAGLTRMEARTLARPPK